MNRFGAAVVSSLVILSVASGLSAQTPSCSTPTSNGLPLTLTIVSPGPGDIELVEEPCCGATVPIIGTASVGLPLFDFYFVIDASGSTGVCTGSDIDGDGVVGTTVGQTCTDLDDSVLAAQLRAVGDFVDLLDPLTARVAVIQFSFPGPRQRIVQSLTANYTLVDTALADILTLGAQGATDYGGAITLVLSEFMTNGDPINRRQLVYFMSDGVPTYPAGIFNVEDPGDSQAALDAADLAAAEDITINTFGVGFIPSLTQDPVLPPRCLNGGGVLVSTLECIALRTGGTFFASSDPAAIVAQLSIDLPTLGVQSVTVFNDTNGEFVVATLQADGTWVAQLPTWPDGINFLRAVALANDGSTCEALTHVVPMCVDSVDGFVIEAGAVLAATSPMSPLSPLSPLSPATSCAPSSAPSSQGFWQDSLHH